MGQAPPEVGTAAMRVIILHGWAYQTDRWQPLLRALKAKGIKAEFPNIPVLTGKADKPWSLNDYMAWLKQMVGDDKVILIGHSNGGRLVLNFASRCPDSVERLILIDSAGVPRTELSSRIKRSVFWLLAKLGKPLANVKPLRRLLYKLARAQDYLEADPIARATMSNLLKSDYSLDLSAIATPANIIWGANDVTTPLKDAYTLAKRLPNAEAPVVIDGGRHSPQFTHTDQVADCIIGMVGK